MSETEQQPRDSDAPVPETGPATARIRRTPWRGWLMAIPLAALILVGYLVIRTWLLTGPTVTVTFPKSEGIGPQGTVVKYKGLEVGSVTDVKFIDNLHRVKVTLDMKSSVADALNSNTRFWIVKPSVTSGNISALLSGAYVAMRPGGGAPQSHFKGALHPPAVKPERPGRVVTLTADDKHGLVHGSVVQYRGLNAGHVLGAAYDAKHDDVRIKVFVKSPFDKRLGRETRFWRSGGFGIDAGAGGLDIKTPGLKSLIKGGVAFANIPTQQPVSDGKRAHKNEPDRRLYTSRVAARSALDGPSIALSISPPGSLNGLGAHAPVVLDGVKVGRVTSTRVRYDPKKHGIATSATLKIYGKPMQLNISQADDHDQANLQNALNDLVKNGLRAKLVSSTPVLGGEQVVLTMTGQRDATGLNRTLDPPGIPVIAGGGIDQIVDTLSAVANKVNAVPIDDIGRNVNQLAANARRISGSPKIKQALAQLDHSLANVRAITARANGRVKPMLESLDSAAKAAESAAQKINHMTGGTGAGQANIEKLVGELTRTARSIRTLTNYLQRHPEALIKGRSQ